jgi:DNA-binding MarR family transcriptional regulator
MSHRKTPELNQDAQSFCYRLSRRQLTPSMEKILKALDEWSENNPEAASCQQIADLAGVHQTYIQRIICGLEQAGYVKLWRHRSGLLCTPGVFVLKGYKVYAGIEIS